MHGLDRALAGWLPTFLPAQRWFGGKARSIRATALADLAPIGTDPDVVVAVVRVLYADGADEQYALLLASLADAGSLPTLGAWPPPAAGWVVEAAGDPGCASRLLRPLAGRGRIATMRGGELIYGDLGAAAARDLTGTDLPVKAVGAEQSNTSLRVGSTLVFKLFRRLEAGENPELEVGRFLTTRTDFQDMSRLEGSVSYQSPGGSTATLGVLQTWIDNEGDGWRHVLGLLGEQLRTGATAARLADEARHLGQVTADLHAALERGGTEAFDPERVERRDIESWTTRFRERARHTFSLIESRLDSGDGDARLLARDVLSLRDRAGALAAEVEATPPGAFVRIRIHGDYHLGQTLRTAGGYAIVDFEGEPARTLADRREKQCALRDVAGMLRSFDYAIETACQHERQRAAPLRDALGLDEAFLDAYIRRATSRGAASIPRDRQAIDRWLRFLELDKALYEVEYEVNNRPAWIDIPLRGILRALDHRSA
jgi:trehalose synthase-fused probable maltokinase